MEITREQREERYQKAPAGVQQMYESDESGKFLFSIFQKHALPPENYRAYGITIGNVILGFYPLWQLPELLHTALSITPAQAEAIATDLRPFFAPLERVGTPVLENTQSTEKANTAVVHTVAETLVRDLHLDPERIVPLINIVGDTVLGLVAVNALPAHIQTQIGAPLPLAQLIAEHLLVLLAQAHALPVTPPPALAPTITPKLVTPATWTHVTVPPVVAPLSPQTQPAAPSIPQYQKPLITVPQYHNAHLYEPPQNTDQPPPTLPQ